ncbi:amidase [Thermomonospora catenispora]|uniref:amidase n=1 Tax=Thermomonospora catenispora TaxID=2493090 RepID=UPI00111CD170|nr:amidase [Thermomonospora catenispora]TNY36293.1 amidase [Thermomonospora catenispora]
MVTVMDTWIGRSVAELHALYRGGEATPSQIVEECLRRIEASGPLGAYTTVLAETARAEAERLDRRMGEEPMGPLFGVPVAVKELIDVAGAEVGYGSRAFAGRIASADAEAVRRLRAAGAIVVGVTRSPEFGWSLSGRDAASLTPVANPWDPARDPGGSSSGSAVAVATGTACLALGTDTAGSIRMPAALCGVWGFKPTRGAVSDRGVRLLSRSFDHVGPLAGTLSDLRAAHEALGGWPVSPQDAPDPGTVVVAPDDGLHPDHAEALAAAARRFAELGWRVLTEDVAPPEDVVDGYMTMLLHEGARLYADDPGSSVELCTEPVRDMLRLGDGVTDDLYRDARRTVARYRAGLLARLDLGTLLLGAVCPGPPHPSRAATVDTADGPRPFARAVVPWTLPQSIAGLPAVAVPAGRDRDGMPIGLQLSGAPGRDGTVLAAAALIAERDAGTPRRPA